MSEKTCISNHKDICKNLEKRIDIFNKNKKMKHLPELTCNKKCDYYKPTWITECKQKALNLTREKRQEFLDYIWQGKTIGEAGKLCNLSFDETVGIMNLNIKDNKYLSLNTTSE